MVKVWPSVTAFGAVTVYSSFWSASVLAEIEPPYARQIVLTSVVVETFDGVNGPLDAPAGTSATTSPPATTMTAAIAANRRATTERLRPSMSVPPDCPLALRHRDM